MCDGAPTKNVNPPTSMYQERARSVARPKRWFHMNQDINQDPEFEYFCKKCGLAGVRFFIEAMAILDKTDNHWCLHKNWNTNTLARRCGTQSKQILNSYQTMLELSWIKVATDSEQSMYIYAPNFLKYRGNRVHEHAMTIAQSSTPPSLPFPSLTNSKKERLTISHKKCSPHKKADVHMKHDEWFMEFYQAYPKHVAKEEAKTAWDKLCLNEELFGQIMAGVERYKKSEVVQRREGGGAFIKQPGPWLNGKRWDDEGFIPVKAERKFVP